MLLMSSGSKKKEPRYLCLSEAKNVGRGFLFYSTRRTQWTVYQFQQVKVSSQGVVSSKKVSHNPGLSPIKGQKFGLETRARSRD